MTNEGKADQLKGKLELQHISFQPSNKILNDELVISVGASRQRKKVHHLTSGLLDRFPSITS